MLLKKKIVCVTLNTEVKATSKIAMNFAVGEEIRKKFLISGPNAKIDTI
jgi:hypothetical protein